MAGATPQWDRNYRDRVGVSTAPAVSAIFLRPEQIVLAAPGEGVVRVGDVALQVRLTDETVPDAAKAIGLRVVGEGLAFAEKPAG
jgi:hypothetical protein